MDVGVALWGFQQRSRIMNESDDIAAIFHGGCDLLFMVCNYGEERGSELLICLLSSLNEAVITHFHP